MTKEFLRARRSWYQEQERTQERLTRMMPFSIKYGFNNSLGDSYQKAAEQLGIEFAIFHGAIWFMTEEDLNAVRICL